MVADNDGCSEDFLHFDLDHNKKMSFLECFCVACLMFDIGDSVCAKHLLGRCPA
jgi:hypothetical protein